MTENGLLDPAAAAAVGHAKGVRQPGERAGNWLTKAQANALLNAPRPRPSRGSATPPSWALLLGCGLRRAELLGLDVLPSHAQMQYWMFAPSNL